LGLDERKEVLKKTQTDPAADDRDTLLFDQCFILDVADAVDHLCEYNKEYPVDHNEDGSI
jgi:hypothetical protein